MNMQLTLAVLGAWRRSIRTTRAARTMLIAVALISAILAVYLVCRMGVTHPVTADGNTWVNT